MQRFTVREQVFLMILLPTLIALVMLINDVWQDRARLAELDRMAPAVSLAKQVGVMVHELQKERGASTGFISSNGEASFKAALETIRKAANNAIASFRDLDVIDTTAMSVEFLSKMAKARDGFAALSEQRAKIDAFKVDASGVIAFYSGLINDLISISGSAVDLLARNSIENELRAYRYFLLEKERAGIERATGTAMFIEGKFNPDRYWTYVQGCSTLYSPLYERLTSGSMAAAQVALAMFVTPFALAMLSA